MISNGFPLAETKVMSELPPDLTVVKAWYLTKFSDTIVATLPVSSKPRTVLDLSLNTIKLLLCIGCCTNELRFKVRLDPRLSPRGSHRQ